MAIKGLSHRIGQRKGKQYILLVWFMVTSVTVSESEPTTQLKPILHRAKCRHKICHVCQVASVFPRYFVSLFTKRITKSTEALNFKAWTLWDLLFIYFIIITFFFLFFKKRQFYRLPEASTRHNHSGDTDIGWQSRHGTDQAPKQPQPQNCWIGCTKRSSATTSPSPPPPAFGPHWSCLLCANNSSQRRKKRRKKEDPEINKLHSNGKTFIVHGKESMGTHTHFSMKTEKETTEKKKWGNYFGSMERC